MGVSSCCGERLSIIFPETLVLSASVIYNVSEETGLDRTHDCCEDSDMVIISSYQLEQKADDTRTFTSGAAVNPVAPVAAELSV